jgi:hypothetical protein
MRQCAGWTAASRPNQDRSQERRRERGRAGTGGIRTRNERCVSQCSGRTKASQPPQMGETVLPTPTPPADLWAWPRGRSKRPRMHQREPHGIDPWIWVGLAAVRKVLKHQTCGKPMSFAAGVFNTDPAEPVQRKVLSLSAGHVPRVQPAKAAARTAHQGPGAARIPPFDRRRTRERKVARLRTLIDPGRNQRQSVPDEQSTAIRKLAKPKRERRAPGELGRYHSIGQRRVAFQSPENAG